jgi:stress response protein YsnF
VLLLPKIVDLPRWQAAEFPVDLTREQVCNSPEIDLAQPVSRQMEQELHDYYRWTPYWKTGGRALIAAAEAQTAQDRETGDPHLRSAREMMGYHIQARDGEIGHIKDFFVEGDCWCIRYVLVNTRNWLPGRDVLIAQRSLTKVDWAETKVYVDLTRQQVKESPEYDVKTPISRAYEERLHQHYRVPAYWLQKPFA